MPNRAAGSSTGHQQIALLWKTRQKLLKWLRSYNQNKNGSAEGESEVQLDEECAKVFAMDGGVSTVFNFRDSKEMPPPTKPKYDEKDFKRKSTVHSIHTIIV
ncbi:uncharacterized protein LOC125505615 isoform X2 [Dendroctonus ponderosae]|uniref:uncharacterized protein LOC125505615 isoform X2 n=1 Tax=Dendroctonus ponderosae TaxID=77166 RepID=UPI00203601EA|nr:uncharacterized protein LOC125505615 isoform X2 [Dendroctonus ponderosae]